MFVSAEAPRPVETQVHAQHQLVPEAQEELLAVRVRGGEPLGVDQRGCGGKAALRRGDGKDLPAKDIVKLAGKSVYGVAFGHGGVPWLG